MEAVIRGVAIYIILLVIIRLSGRRTLAQMTAFDLVLLLIVAETTQQALLGDDFSIANAVLLILTLFLTDILLSYVKKWMPTAAKWIDGTPTVLISLGAPDYRAMKRARIELKDILDAAREQHGLERLDQIKFAVLEIGGHISIIPAKERE
jgi:uncharacterized membrane protein YcaP (DUF421 family)